MPQATRVTFIRQVALPVTFYTDGMTDRLFQTEPKTVQAEHYVWLVTTCLLCTLLCKKSHLTVFPSNAKCVRFAAGRSIQECDTTYQ